MMIVASVLIIVGLAFGAITAAAGCVKVDNKTFAEWKYIYAIGLGAGIGNAIGLVGVGVVLAATFH